VGLGRKDKDFAISNTTGAGDFNQLVNDLVGSRVLDPGGDLHLRQKSKGILAVVVLVEVAFLAAHAFDLTDFHCLERCAAQTVKDFFGQKRFDNRDDLFHEKGGFGAQPCTALTADRFLTKKVFAKKVELGAGFDFDIALDGRFASEPHRLFVADERQTRNGVG